MRTVWRTWPRIRSAGPPDKDVLGDPDVVVDQGHHGVFGAADRTVVVREGGQVGGLVAVHVAVGVAAGQPDLAELAGPGRGLRARVRRFAAPAASGTIRAKTARMVV